MNFASAIDQDELLQLLKDHNNNRKQQPSTSPNQMHIDHLMDKIRNLSLSNDISNELALNACFFITHYHTDKALLLSSND